MYLGHGDKGKQRWPLSYYHLLSLCNGLCCWHFPPVECSVWWDGLPARPLSRLEACSPYAFPNLGVKTRESPGVQANVFLQTDHFLVERERLCATSKLGKENSPDHWQCSHYSSLPGRCKFTAVPCRFVG